jgi:hypothetical protein
MPARAAGSHLATAATAGTQHEPDPGQRPSGAIARLYSASERGFEARSKIEPGRPLTPARLEKLRTGVWSGRLSCSEGTAETICFFRQERNK